ncbi:MAG: 2'-5' RNA ligase family protein [Acidobacteriaceae bacterium]|nr:2'-5' RNA ligase family protein [Acidobacteriaceae bacterium]
MPKNGMHGAAERGQFALVSYIPEPLSSFFNRLRRGLPGDGNPQAHVTILPPRPLRAPVERASEQAQKILASFPAFEIELSTVQRFPETNFLYLDIAHGNSRVHDLHDALNDGELAFAEEFEFRPHLTLGGPIPEKELASLQGQTEAAWLSAEHARRFVVDEVVFLWLNPAEEDGEWRRVWSYNLRTHLLRTHIPQSASSQSQGLARTQAASVTNRTS